jgi:hypothetical protein
MAHILAPRCARQYLGERAGRKTRSADARGEHNYASRHEERVPCTTLGAQHGLLHPPCGGMAGRALGRPRRHATRSGGGQDQRSRGHAADH